MSSHVDMEQEEKVVGKPGIMKRMLAGVGMVVSIVYLLNFTLGIVEIPDNLPVVGHIDEVFACAVLFTCLGVMGVRLPGQWR